MSPSKSPTHWVFSRRCYGHSWYNDYNRNCEGKFGENARGLTEEGKFLGLENFSVRGRSNYDKGVSDWTIEISTATKVSKILPFDPPIKFFFHV